MFIAHAQYDGALHYDLAQQQLSVHVQILSVKT